MVTRRIIDEKGGDAGYAMLFTFSEKEGDWIEVISGKPVERTGPPRIDFDDERKALKELRANAGPQSENPTEDEIRKAAALSREYSLAITALENAEDKIARAEKIKRGE